MAALTAGPGPDFTQLLQGLQSDVSSVRKQAEARYDQLKASSPGPTLQVSESSALAIGAKTSSSSFLLSSFSFFSCSRSFSLPTHSCSSRYPHKHTHPLAYLR